MEKVKKYDNIVVKSKQLMSLYNARTKEAAKARQEIADYALAAKKIGFTLTVFADDVGIPYSTLMTWCGDRADETDQDIEGKLGASRQDRAVIKRVLGKSEPNTPARDLKKLYDYESVRSKENIVLENFFIQVGRGEFNICHSFLFEKNDIPYLKKIGESCLNIGLHISNIVEGTHGRKTESAQRSATTH